MAFSKRLIVLGLFAAVAMPRIAEAQNLLVNPNFNAGITGWGNIGGATFDATTEASGSVTPGSARWAGTLAAPNSGANAGVSQCINGITAGATYDFGGQVLVTSLPTGGAVDVLVAFYPAVNCGGSNLASSAGTHITTTGTFQLSGGSLLAPAGTLSALVQENELTSTTGGDFIVNFDDMLLQQSSAVPAMPHMWLLGLGALLAIATVHAARRAGRLGVASR